MNDPLLDEHLLQYINPGQGGECELVIGLDFGTSASKVVVQIPFLAGEPAYAVDFGQFAHSTMVHLLPTQIFVDSNGKCSIASFNGECKKINDIKIELIREVSDLYSNYGPTQQGYDPETVAVAYLALLLRHTRKWFLETKRDIIGHFTNFNWHMNLGVPSKSIDTNEENQKFERVGKAAWALSVLEKQITIEKAKKELELINNSNYWECDKEGVICEFNIYPEIIAGAFGYKSSEHRREGLHLIVDVGASTVDVCSFNLFEREGSDVIPMLTADVKPLGTVRIHHDRIKAILDKHKDQAQQLRDNHDPLSPISEDIEQYFLSREQLISEVQNAEERLKNECIGMLHEIVHTLKTRRDPLDRVFQGEVPLSFLLIGGGSKLLFYSSLIGELDQRMRSWYINSHRGLRPQPKEDDKRWGSIR